MNGDCLSLPLDETFSAKLLDNPVGVYSRDTASISNIRLPGRHRKCRPLHKAHGLKPQLKLAEHMGNARNGLAGSDVDYPFPENGGIHQSLPPKCVRQLLGTRQHFTEVGMR